MTSPSALRVVSLESRNAIEMVRLLERHGCIAISAPSMREIPLRDEREVLAFGERLLAGECDVLVLLTGVGLRTLVDALAVRWPRADVLAALSKTRLVCRGPKPVAVLKALGLRAVAVAPEPNTWRELLGVIDREVPVSGQRVFVQEYGKPSTELLASLASRGATVQSVAVYAWALPEDLAPLEGAIDTLCGRQADVLTITSGRQVEHLLDVAERRGRRALLLSALHERVVIASIGPVATETLAEHGLPADIAPAHPKMGHLVLAIAKEGPDALASKLARGAGAAVRSA